MKTIKNWKSLLLTSAAAAMFLSCTESNDGLPAEGESEVIISATVANSDGSPNARTNSLVYGNIAITDVGISVDNIKLKLKVDGNNGTPHVIPFSVNQPVTASLVKDGQILVAPLVRGLASFGIYGSAIFDLVKAANVPPTHEMYGYSVIAKATWFNIPAVMYLDLEDQVELDFEKDFIVNGTQNLVLTLYMDKLLEGIPPSSVADGNSDGLIELGPNDVDGNGEAYAAIKENVKKALVFRDGNFQDS
jgi:hypothetical protein